MSLARPVARAIVIARERGRELVLIQGRADSGLTEFPGGHGQPGESPIETALRELEEETGYAGLVRSELHFIVDAVTGPVDFIVMYVPRRFEPTIDPHEVEWAAWYTLDECIEAALEWWQWLPCCLGALEVLKDGHV